MRRYLYILICVLALSACKQSNTPQPPSLILEGWIDAGDIPVVLIHKSYVLDNFTPSSEDDETSIEDVVEELLIPFGRVAVSDGTDEVVLTGRIDTAYLPPYTYSSLDMEGVVGKTYTVTVKYKQYHATATTTIPPVATLDSLRVKSHAEDALDIRAYMSGINPNEEAYYALFARKAKTKQFQLCPFGVFQGKDAKNGQLEIKVYNPYSDTNHLDKSGFLFYADPEAETPQIYQLKIARIDYPSYCYWKAYNEQIITRGILFVPVYKNIPGNVSGGQGIFTGMGSSIYSFSLSPDSTYRFSNP
jgi:hypothetical protein